MNQRGQAQVLILAGIVLLVAVAGGIFFLGRMTLPRQDSSGQAAPKPQTQTPVVTSSPQPSPTPSPTSSPDPTATWKTHTNSKYGFSIKYPPSWKILETVPLPFRATKSYVEGTDLNTWLNSKMFAESCRGPILQNTDNDKLLIAFEIVPVNDDGSFCWSRGYFFEENKWKIESSYLYPPGSNNRFTPEWKGDYLKMEKIENNKHIAFVSLVNRETYKLIGEDEFNQILSTFKFTN